MTMTTATAKEEEEGTSSLFTRKEQCMGCLLFCAIIFGPGILLLKFPGLLSSLNLDSSSMNFTSSSMTSNGGDEDHDDHNNHLCIDRPNRCRPLNASGSFSFVHISKCAGSSFISDFRDLLPDFVPWMKALMEYSVDYTLDKYPNRNYRMISIRSPRHHLWSQYTLCRYSAWGKTHTVGTDFPKSGNEVDDFRLWLKHFLIQPPSAIDHYNCFHAPNVQARFMTTFMENVQDIDKIDPNLRFEPNLQEALKRYWIHDFVGLTEFYKESFCIFFFRLQGDNENHAFAESIHFLQNKCTCSLSTEPKVTHKVHHVNGHRSTLRDLPLDILNMTAMLTKVDVPLYVVGLKQFIKEVAWVEHRLGRRFLCDSTIDRYEPELDYLGVSLRQLYVHEKQVVSNAQWF